MLKNSLLLAAYKFLFVPLGNSDIPTHGLKVRCSSSELQRLRKLSAPPDYVTQTLMVHLEQGFTLALYVLSILCLVSPDSDFSVSVGILL